VSALGENMKRFILIKIFMILLFNIQLSANEIKNNPDIDYNGKYFFGDGLGVNCHLTLAEDTFSFLWRGCLGVYGENSGTFTISNNKLNIFPAKQNIQKGFGGTPTEFIFISWGNRLYLIPDNDTDLIDFCNSINQNSEPREDVHGQFYLKENNENIKVSDYPKLPKKYSDYLLNKPLKGKIIKIINKKLCIVNIGKNNGLKKGMELFPVESDDFITLETIDVYNDTAIIKNKYKGDKIKKKYKVSTRY